jgi:hypothetical protein
LLVPQLRPAMMPMSLSYAADPPCPERQAPGTVAFDTEGLRLPGHWGASRQGHRYRARATDSGTAVGLQAGNGVA